MSSACRWSATGMSSICTTRNCRRSPRRSGHFSSSTAGASSRMRSASCRGGGGRAWQRNEPDMAANVTAHGHMKLTILGALSLCAALAVRAAAASPTRQLMIEGVDMRVDLEAGEFRDGAEPLIAWIKRSAGIVAGYYGRFPTPALRIQVVPEAGGGVRGGKTFGSRGGFIRVQVGRDVTGAQLHDDWVLVHEMAHLALPDVGEGHEWLAEGLATYVEGVARVQAGNRSETDVWAEEIRSMTRGLPQPGDRGLDHTHTWGRTYWGGAMFCLLAAVEIHRR